MLIHLEGQQKEIQYPGWHRDTTGKELWSGENENNSFFVWGDIKWGIADKTSMPKALSYSH